jgi:hypothetical protein
MDVAIDSSPAIFCLTIIDCAVERQREHEPA